MNEGTSITVRLTHPYSPETAPMIYLEFGEDRYLINLDDASGLIEDLKRGVQDSPQYPPGIVIRLGADTYGIRADGAGRLSNALETEIQTASVP